MESNPDYSSNMHLHRPFPIGYRTFADGKQWMCLERGYSMPATKICRAAFAQLAKQVLPLILKLTRGCNDARTVVHRPYFTVIKRIAA